MSRTERIRKLDSLVADAARRVQQLTARNTKLKAEVARLTEANGHLDSQLKRFRTMSRRQEKVRNRLERMVVKLDKALELAG